MTSRSLFPKECLILRRAWPLAVLFLAFTAAHISAEPLPTSPPSVPPRPDLIISWDKTAAANIPIEGTADLQIHLKNISPKSIEITHLALNTPAAFVPIGPFALKPDEAVDFPLELQGKNLALPASLVVFFQLQDGSYRNCPIELSSKDILLVEPRFVMWHVGEPAQPKAAHITNIPQGLKITGVSSSSPAFTVKLDGDTITITPPATAQPQMGNVAITTEPASRHRTFISAAVMPVPASKPPSSVSSIPSDHKGTIPQTSGT